MKRSFWEEKWKTLDIGFHQAEPSRGLQRFHSELPSGKTLVPLCGKTRDLVYLSDQGHEVVGSELSSIACESFFSENNLSFQKTHQGSFDVYSGKKHTLFCGDFFELEPQLAGTFSSAFDRAALIALPPDLRKKYAAQVCKLLQPISPEKKILLITIDYPDQGLEGPPFSVREEEIQSLYGQAFEIRCLDRKLAQDPPKKFGSIPVHEAIYLLTGKKG